MPGINKGQHPEHDRDLCPIDELSGCAFNKPTEASHFQDLRDPRMGLINFLPINVEPVDPFAENLRADASQSISCCMNPSRGSRARFSQIGTEEKKAD